VKWNRAPQGWAFRDQRSSSSVIGELLEQLNNITSQHRESVNQSDREGRSKGDAKPTDRQTTCRQVGTLSSYAGSQVSR
jgi:hypothetical protein